MPNLGHCGSSESFRGHSAFLGAQDMHSEQPWSPDRWCAWSVGNAYCKDDSAITRIVSTVIVSHLPGRTIRCLSGGTAVHRATRQPPLGQRRFRIDRFGNSSCATSCGVAVDVNAVAPDSQFDWLSQRSSVESGADGSPLLPDPCRFCRTRSNASARTLVSVEQGHKHPPQRGEVTICPTAPPTAVSTVATRIMVVDSAENSRISPVR